MSHMKRPAAGDPSHHDPGKRHHGDGVGSNSDHPPRPSFPSYLDAGLELPPKVRLLCEILATTSPSSAVERALDDSGVLVSTDDVETVLKLSYSHPAPAVAFFRWAGSRHLAHRHSPYSWNLVVDLLGKNRLFDAMWDAVRSMRSEGLLSLATYAAIFSSLAAAGCTVEALSSFDKMNLHGVPRDTAALNSLLSALCREGLVATARTAFGRICATGSGVLPDSDTFAILLEGCENELDHHAARKVFDDMIITIGWDPANVPAYDSYLTTLVQSGSHGISEALRFLEKMKAKRCFPGMKFFRAALKVFVENKDSRGAFTIWEELTGHNGCFPDTPMYNSLIALQCYLGHVEAAMRLLDEMVVYGAFPDSETYNVLLQFLLNERKLREAASMFNEMVKNECYPTEANCRAFIRMLLDSGEWEMALKVWKCMVANGLPPLEESGNMLVLSLRDMDKLPEACKYAEDMIDRGIKLNSSTLSKLRQSLLKIGKGSIHDHLLSKWKSH